MFLRSLTLLRSFTNFSGLQGIQALDVVSDLCFGAVVEHTPLSRVISQDGVRANDSFGFSQKS